MRFRRRVKVIPGVYLNLSKSGISTTIGVPGASINIGKQGTYLNTGIPGTGIYDRKKIDGNIPQDIPSLETENFDFTFANEVAKSVYTKDIVSTTSRSLEPLKKTINGCYQERKDIQEEISKLRNKTNELTLLLIFSYLIIVGFFLKKLKVRLKNNRSYIKDLEDQYKKCIVNVDIEMDEKVEINFNELVSTFIALASSEKIWDITSSINQDRIKARSSASTILTRKKVGFQKGKINILKTQYDVLHIKNAKGVNLYIYPAFLLIQDVSNDFGLINIRELEVFCTHQRFVENELVPSDAKVVDHSWLRENKNGGPDRRFKNNYQIPICQYGEIELKSKTGLNELFAISNYDSAVAFEKAFNTYKKNW